MPDVICDHFRARHSRTSVKRAMGKHKRRESANSDHRWRDGD
jgi:hypothetical protein